MKMITFALVALAASGATALTAPRRQQPVQAITRRHWLSTVSVLVSAATIAPSTTSASVFFDPDRYGDKELKIAFVNKIRQNVRDAIVAQPALASQFLQIVIQDGLTYNSDTRVGGPDGSVVAAILSNDAPAELVSLQSAAAVLLDLKAKLKKTTEISMADLVTFAGAEAIESTGGPRVVVQLGKLDPKAYHLAKSYPSFDSSSQVVDAFASAGLSPREVALLFGAVGAINKVVSGLIPVPAEVFEENEMGDVEAYVPTSFGAPGEIYGRRLGMLDDSIFQDVVTDLDHKKGPFSSVFKDEAVADWARKYATKKVLFSRDLPEAYNKLIGLGKSYTGGKVENLLGTGIVSDL